MDYKTKEAMENHKSMAGAMFRSKATDKWVENACGKCRKGMMRHIYEHQKIHRPGNIICSTCDKKERKRELKKEGF